MRNSQRFGPILTLTPQHERFITRGPLRIRPVDGRHGMLSERVLSRDRILQKRFKSGRGHHPSISFLRVNIAD